jgi:hypothetical protein
VYVKFVSKHPGYPFAVIASISMMSSKGIPSKMAR